MNHTPVPVEEVIILMVLILMLINYETSNLREEGKADDVFDSR